MITSSIHIEFDITLKRYRVVDTTDYAATGINAATSQMKGLGTIKFNGSIIEQHNTVIDPLINIELGATTSPWYSLPLDVNGEVVNGTWTCEDYSLRVVGNGVQFTSITLPYTIVTDGSSWVYDFVSVGNTITLTGGTPQNVIVSNIADGTPNATITTSTVIASATHDDIDFDVTNVTGSFTHTYSGCKQVSAELELSYDCDSGPSGTFTSVDATVLGTHEVVTRAMVINPPASAPLIPMVITSQSSYTVTNLATMTWNVSLTLDLSYTQSDGAVILYQTTKVEEAKVSCKGALCELNACLETLRKMHVDALKLGSSPYQSTVDSVLIYHMKAKGYKECGKMDEYRIEIGKIEDLLGGIDCLCHDEDEGAIYINNVDSDTLNAIEQLQSDLQYKLFVGVPSTGQDQTLGYVVGSILQDVNTGIEYRCTSNAIGAATWVEYYNPSTATLPYKSYVVSLSQPTVGVAPTETVIFNNFTSPPVLGYLTTGSFTYTLAATFLLTKTFLVINQNDTSSGGAVGVGRVAAKRINDGVIVIATRDETNALADTVLDNTCIEIRVYN